MEGGYRARIVMTVRFSSHFQKLEIILMPGLTKIAWDLSKTSFIPLILGLLRVVPRCLYCSRRTSQLFSLHILDSRLYLSANEPSVSIEVVTRVGFDKILFDESSAHSAPVVEGLADIPIVSRRRPTDFRMNMKRSLRVDPFRAPAELARPFLTNIRNVREAETSYLKRELYPRVIAIWILGTKHFGLAFIETFSLIFSHRNRKLIPGHTLYWAR